MNDTTDTTDTPDALDGLAAEAHALHAEIYNAENPGAGPPPAPEPPRLENAQIIGGALTMARDVFTSFTGMRSVQAVATPQKVEMLANAWAAVCDERGIDLQQYMGKHATLFAALGVTAMVGMELRAAVAAEMAMMDRAAKDRAAVDATAGTPE